LFQGKFLICREALIEGPLDKKDFHQQRASFLGVSLEEYRTISSSQFDAIKLIPESSDVYLWFEDDLFCQCNLWYVVNFILSIPLKANIYLVRPSTDSWLGFGYMSEEQFAQAYKNKTLLSQEQLSAFQQLWKMYSKETEGDLMSLAKVLNNIIPRIESVIQAHLDRLPPINKPEETLKAILQESEDKSFPAIFKEFSKRMGIYGFGDTSVKVMYDSLVK